MLLSGREKAWPDSGEYRTSPEGEPFTGVVFHIDAVYQKTIAELEARASPFWLLFAPLAADAEPSTMARAITALRRRTNDQEFEGLTAAMLIMADADKRRRDLKDAILPLLEKGRSEPGALAEQQRHNEAIWPSSRRRARRSLLSKLLISPKKILSGEQDGAGTNTAQKGGIHGGPPCSLLLIS